MINVSSPGKIILFGEHAVVYDKLGIACAIDKRCELKVLPSLKKAVFINSKNLNLSGFLEEKALFSLYDRINNLKEQNRFEDITKIAKQNDLISSFFVVANIFKKYGFRPLKMEVDSSVPKNLGSSSSLFSAIAFGVLKFLNKDASKKEVSDFAYQGDIVAHGGTPSGIDNSTVVYGGYVEYQKSKGINPLIIDFKIPLLVVDSGEKVKTGELVSYVRNQKKENPEFVNSVLNNLDNISKRALKVLNLKKLDDLGILMTAYYKELKKLNISTPKLDKIINIALKNKALGAKPTGAWGGGCCLVLTKDKKNMFDLKNIFDNNGFSSFQAKIGVKGVKII